MGAANPANVLESRVLDKQKCDRIKSMIKKLLIGVDDLKTGFVKSDVF